MGEAMLVRKGGASFRRLVVLKNPDRMAYYAGMMPALNGAIIGAQFGTLTVPLHETGWEAENTRITEENPYINISAIIGRRKRTTQIPVNIIGVSEVLNENSWDTIAQIGEIGKASEIWHVGDEKWDRVNGVDYLFKIVGFDADDLDVTDERYNDATYNENKKKAAITFQIFTCPNTDRIHNVTSDAGWDTCYMRNTILPNLFSAFPSDLQSVIRTVKKYTVHGRYASSNDYERGIINTADRLFIPAAAEMAITGTAYHMMEKGNTPFYEYYAKGGAILQNSWTRSSDGPTCGVDNHYVYYLTTYFSLDDSSDGLLDKKYYYPLFCL